MRTLLTSVLLYSIVLITVASQVPFSYQLKIRDWDLETGPDADTTVHLIFEGVASLLQHWPNTRYRNGHNIVPGTIATGTSLYHSRPDNHIPSSPDWVATDPEHSLFFCHDPCWHLTLEVARPLKVLYFDGTSAAKLKGGPLDSQDILLWGETKPEWIFNERERIDKLCRWGKAFNLDGFVRMEMDFELMLCNFTEGVRTSSFLQLSTAYDSDRHPPLPGYPLSPRAFEVLNAGAWHNHYPGDTRIKLDISRLISFYDASLAPSLIKKRRSQQRWQHQLQGISRPDVRAIMHRLTDYLAGDFPSRTQVDWASMIRAVVDRFAGRLDLLRYILQTSSSSTISEPLSRATAAQVQLRTMLQPYILVSAIPPIDHQESGSSNLTWLEGVYQTCSTSGPNLASDEGFTLSERTILSSIRGTKREICRTITTMWGEGVSLGLDKVPPPREHPNLSKVQQALASWETKLTALMSWLDWSVWVRCEPECDVEEMCYLPTWPFSLPANHRHPPPHPVGPRATPISDDISTDEDDWDLPKPKCIRRIGPYST